MSLYRSSRSFFLFAGLFCTAVAWADTGSRTWKIAEGLQARVGFDDNPVASGGAAERVLGGQDTLFYGMGFNVATNLAETASNSFTVKLAYSAETMRYDRWHLESFFSHKLGLSGQLKLSDWLLTCDVSKLFW